MTARPGILEQLWSEPRELSRFEAFTDLLELAGTDRELVTSERALSERWRWSSRRVRAFLQLLVDEAAIALEVVTGPRGIVGTRIRLTATPPERSVRARTTCALPSLPQGTEPKQVKRAPCNDLRASAKQVIHNSAPGVVVVVGSKDLKNQVLTQGAHRVENVYGERPEQPEQQLRSPEHERYAEELSATLNQAQLANPLIDSDADAFRPVQSAHRGTLEAAFAIAKAGVPLEYAKRYVWREAQRFKPSPRSQQIGSLAYLRRGMITEWLRSRATKQVQERRQEYRQEHRSPRGKPVAIADVLASVTPIPPRSKQ